MVPARRLLPPLLAVCVLLGPGLAQAHGSDAEEPYDPLALDLALFPAAEAALAEAAPAAGAVFFRAGEPNAPHPPLEFTYPLPGRFVAGADAKVALRVALDRPMVSQDKDGNSFEVFLALGGEPVPGASALLKVPQTSLGVASGPATLEATLKTTGLALEPGAPLALRIRPLMPVVPPEGLRLLVGGDPASTLLFPLLRVPGLPDLRLQDAPLEEILASAPVPKSTGSVVYFDLRVSHGAIELAATEPVQGRKAFLLLRGVEPSADAHEHHEFPDPDRRAGAAHHLQVGDTLVRVHPGVAVKLPLAPGPDGLTVLVKCVLNCPEGGFERVIQLLQADDPSGATGGTLIPPPRSTKGIPVSKDAPVEEKRNLLPAPGAASLVGVAAAAGLLGCAMRRKP